MSRANRFVWRKGDLKRKKKTPEQGERKGEAANAEAARQQLQGLREKSARCQLSA